jgi:muramoyltetrapeptide carboxypeptidase
MAHLGEAGGPFAETVDYLVRALGGSGPLICEPVPSRTGEFVNWLIPDQEASQRHRSVSGGWTWLNSGRASGPLRGGEITLVPELVTHFGLAVNSALLFWHVAFHDYPPDQAFRKLCQTADLTQIAGMVIGAHPSIPPPQWAAFVSDMLDEALPGLACPVVVNADIGNVDPSWTVPYGEEATLDPDVGLIFRSQVTERTFA